MRKIVCIGLVALGAGCVSPLKQDANTDAARKIETAPCLYQRFVPTDFSATGKDYHGLFALDTQTGELCRTADYTLVKPHEGLNTIPTCLSLTQKSKATGGFAAWQEERRLQEERRQK